VGAGVLCTRGSLLIYVVLKSKENGGVRMKRSRCSRVKFMATENKAFGIRKTADSTCEKDRS
jgi:hypothetical protein